MADKNEDAKAKMLAALEAKKNRSGGPSHKGISAGSKVQGGRAGGGAPTVQRKAGPSSSGSSGS